MWFDDLGRDDLARNDLRLFIQRTIEFLRYAIADDELAFLWQDNELLPSARETFETNVLPATDRFIGEIGDANQERLGWHGLTGVPLAFKFGVIKRMSEGLRGAIDAAKGQGLIRGWLKKLFDAIDVVLDSLIAAVGISPFGGAVKEFKDALSAIADSP